MRHSAEFKDKNPRPPQAPRPNDTAALTDEAIQQGIQRLFAAYNQCVTRVAQTDERLEQFRAAVRRDALELALKVQRTSQDLQHQGQSVERIKSIAHCLMWCKVRWIISKKSFGC